MTTNVKLRTVTNTTNHTERQAVPADEGAACPSRKHTCPGHRWETAKPASTARERSVLREGRGAHEPALEPSPRTEGTGRGPGGCAWGAGLSPRGRIRLQPGRRGTPWSGRDGGVSTVTVCVASPQVGGAPSARALRGSAPAHGSAGLSTHAACVGKAPVGTAIPAEPSLCGRRAGAAPTCAQCPAVAVSDAGAGRPPGRAHPGRRAWRRG